MRYHRRDMDVSPHRIFNRQVRLGLQAVEQGWFRLRKVKQRRPRRARRGGLLALRK